MKEKHCNTVIDAREQAVRHFNKLDRTGTSPSLTSNWGEYYIKAYINGRLCGVARYIYTPRSLPTNFDKLPEDEQEACKRLMQRNQHN